MLTRMQPSEAAMRQLRITMDTQVAVLAVAEKESFQAAGRYLGIGKSAGEREADGRIGLRNADERRGTRASF